MDQSWSAADYARHAGFVPALGASVLLLLGDVKGARVLDLGCGDGKLTQELVASGAEVVAIDASADMVRAARDLGIDAIQMDARNLDFADASFDAVFSNAVLHWIKPPEQVAGEVARVLKPQGKFVAEFGGHGNVASICTAIRAALSEAQLLTDPNPWYFPTANEYASVLEAASLEPESLALFPRPTPLPTDARGWLATFGGIFLGHLSPSQREAIVDRVQELLEPSLRDVSGVWTADYVRLRLKAIKR